MKKTVILLLLISLFSSYNEIQGQKLGQTKKSILIYKGIDNESQLGGYIFTDFTTQKKVVINSNQWIDIENCYNGISLNSFTNKLIGQKFDVEYTYALHLCNEGADDYPCKNWVVTSIKKTGTTIPAKKLTLPYVGYLNDPDGYVNVRESMNVSSKVVGKLQADSEVFFYFFPCTDANWLKVVKASDFNGKLITGYVHKSRVKIKTN